MESYTTHPPGSSSAMSRAYVASFSATSRSKRGARAVCPAALTRISYHVGIPWMFDGKTFFPETGSPIRKMACKSRPFALAEPVPFTVAIFNAKSLTPCSVPTSMASLALRYAPVAASAGRMSSTARPA